VETAFSGPRWSKEKISALIRLMKKSIIIKRKFTLPLTSNDTNISQ
jgi:hypothetical protein